MNVLGLESWEVDFRKSRNHQVAWLSRLVSSTQSQMGEGIYTASLVILEAYRGFCDRQRLIAENQINVEETFRTGWLSLCVHQRLTESEASCPWNL